MKNLLKKKAEQMKKELKLDKPRWLHGIPGIKDNGEVRKITKEQKEACKRI